MSLKDYVLNEKGELCHPSRLGAVLPTQPKQDPLPALDHSKKGSGESSPRVAVTFIRSGKRRLDKDNLAFAFKGLQDAVADTLGIDDGDERIDWNYEQRVGKPYGTIVLITTT